MTSVPRAGGGRLVALLLAGGLMLGLMLAPSQADAFTSSPLWKCRASAVYASLAGNNRVEPVVANGNPSTAGNTSPDRAMCATEEAGADNLATPLGVPASVLAAQSASAKTTITPEVGMAIDQKVDATAKVEGLAVPLGGASSVIGARAATSNVVGSCVNGAIQSTGTSEVLGLTLGGTDIPLDALPEALETILAPLGAVADIKFNEQIRDGRSLIVRAAHIKVLPTAGGAPLLDLVIAETKVDGDEFTCDPNKQIPGLNGKICPDGSIYDVLRGLCIITATAQNGLIIVGLPFQGPSGGTVVALEIARAKYGNSTCLSLTGKDLPAFAIVGTNAANRITGTNGRDRMLGRGGNDSLDGGRGDDCIDGNSGSDKVTGGIGNDRLIGRNGNDTLTGNLGNDLIDGDAGNDHLNGGPGKDRLRAGSGNDTVASGYNADIVDAGPGNDAVNIAQQGPRARANCGTGRDKIRLNGSERKLIRGCEIVYVLKDR